jgi:V/A-type H+-transporting ATPase subunit F
MPKEIAFIGDRDSVLGFRAFGIRAVPVGDPAEGREALASVIDDGFSIIFVTEDVYEACSEAIEAYRDEALPTITVLPSVTGSRGLIAAEIQRAVSAAVGADILSETAGT